MASARVTLQDIADALSLSKTTVSLAMRNNRKISAAVRERVMACAKQMGYRPNPLIAAHMAQLRSLKPANDGWTLAFLTNRGLREIERDARTPLKFYYRGAKQRANQLGFNLELFNLEDRGMSPRRLSQILLARGIYGVLVAPLSEGGAVEHVELEWQHFASAMIEHTFEKPCMHTVCNDEYSTIGRLLQRLIDMGFERIGIAMLQRMDEHANHLWLAGYQAFQALARPRHRVPHFISSDWDAASFLQWFERHRPEAIVTINDDIVRWLQEADYEVPRDVSVATVYWKEDRSHLSGFYQNHSLMGAAAVDMVVGQLNNNERGLPESTRTVLIQADWRDGNTVTEPSAGPKRQAPRVWVRS